MIHKKTLRKLRDCSGVTLLEVLVALALLGFLAGSMIEIAAAAGQWTTRAARQNQAAVLAFGILDRYRADSSLHLNAPLNGDDARELLSGQPAEGDLYPWQAEYETYEEAQPQLWQFKVRVVYEGGESEKAVEMCTLLYRPQ